jgi:hypothetical protein
LTDEIIEKKHQQTKFKEGLGEIYDPDLYEENKDNI